MRVRHERPGLVWPVFLIGIGVVFLLNNLGVLPWGVWQTLLGLWPVLLIAAGLDLMLGRRSARGALLAAILVLAVLAGAVWAAVARSGSAEFRSETISQALEGARRGEVEIASGVGNLVIEAQPEATGNLIEGVVALAPSETIATDVRRTGDTLRYEIKSRNAWHTPILPTGAVWPVEKVWRLALSRDVPLDLRVQPGVGHSTLDLAELTVAKLTVAGNVGRVTLTLPRRGPSQVTLDGGVGELVIIVPAGAAARIEAAGGLGGVVTEGRFSRVGRTYTTSTYSASAERIEVRVKGGIGRLLLREEHALTFGLRGHVPAFGLLGRVPALDHQSGAIAPQAKAIASVGVLE